MSSVGARKHLTIQWTQTARETLDKLPRKLRAQIVSGVESLRDCSEPPDLTRPLVGPLRGYYRVTVGKHRIVYSCERETLSSGNVLSHIRIHFIITGMYEEDAREEVYQFALRLLRLGAIKADDDQHKPST